MFARIAATVFAACLLSIIAPPLNWHALHWVAYLPMFWALRADTPRANLRLGVLYGTVAVASIFWWIVVTIVTFSPGFWPSAAVGVLLLFSVVFGLPYAVLWVCVHPLRARLGRGWVLALPALQVLIEWVSTYVVLFPYQQGVSQYRVATTWQLASVTGVWGLTYLVLLVNSALAEAMYAAREGRPMPRTVVAGALGALAAVITFGAWRYERVEQRLRAAPTAQVAQIQSSVGMEERMLRSGRLELDEWVARTTEIPAGTDLAVWPEGACPYDLKDPESNAHRRLSTLAATKHLELVLGGGSVERTVLDNGQKERTHYNSAYHFRADGSASPRYDKMVPLPFGEYMPFGDWVPDLRRSLGIGDFGSGDTAIVFDSALGTLASPICYEAVLSRVCRRFEGVDLFVTITNDAWFADTGAPHLHAMLAAVRAVELGVPLFRTAYTGVSMVVEPHGAIHYETTPFTDVHRVVTVRRASFDTPYRRWGDWFVWVCAAGLGLAWWRSRRTDHHAPAPRAPLGANGPTRGRV